MTLWLVRHAEHAAALERRFENGVLSERGREQARALGEKLGEVALDLCLTSPLERARETARLALAGRAVPVREEPLLSEGSDGEFAGLTRDEAEQHFPEYFRSGPSVVARLAACGATAPGGESREDFVARARAAAELLSAAESSGSEVLVISHGGLLNYTLQILLGLPVRDEVPFGFDNAGVVRLLQWREEPGFGPFAMLRFPPL